MIGKYHPHSNDAIYDALVRMGQDFSLRYPLVDPQGNFGTTDDPPAAMRYTECRMDQLATVLLDGIDEDTVDFDDNYDGTESEPTVLPSRFPNLLVNGSQGIAVGMATNMPPYNLGEIVEACLFGLEHPDAGAEEYLKIVKGPDFPTGRLHRRYSGQQGRHAHRARLGQDPRRHRRAGGPQGPHGHRRY